MRWPRLQLEQPLTTGVGPRFSRVSSRARRPRQYSLVWGMGSSLGEFFQISGRFYKLRSANSVLYTPVYSGRGRGDIRMRRADCRFAVSIPRFFVFVRVISWSFNQLTPEATCDSTKHEVSEARP